VGGARQVTRTQRHTIATRAIVCGRLAGRTRCLQLSVRCRLQFARIRCSLCAGEQSQVWTVCSSGAQSAACSLQITARNLQQCKIGRDNLKFRFQIFLKCIQSARQFSPQSYSPENWPTGCRSAAGMSLLCFALLKKGASECTY